MFKGLRCKNYRLVAVCLFLLAILFYFYHVVPIQPDEINTRVTNTRLFFDSGFYYSYQFPCFPYPIEIPKLLYPEAAFWTLITKIHNVTVLRLIPFLSYILLALSAGMFVRSFYGARWNQSFVLSGLLFLIFFSSASAIWNVTQRTEYLLVLTLALFSFLASFGNNKHDIGLGQKVILIVVIIMWLSVGYAHPKALYFLPVSVLLLFRNFESKIFKCGVVISILYSSILISSFDFIRLLKCPTNEVFQNWFESMNLNPLELIYSPSSYFSHFIEHLKGHWKNLFSRAADSLTYLANPDIFHVPSVTKRGYLVDVGNTLIKLTYYANLHIFFFSAFYLSLSFFKDLRKSIFCFDTAFILMLNFPVLMIIANNRTTNVYDVQLWFVLFAYCNLLTFFHYASRRNLNVSKFISVFLVMVIVLFSFNFINYYTNYYRVFVRSWWGGSYAGPGVPISYITKKNMQILANDFKSCLGGQRYDLTFIDDRTYMAVEQYPKLFPITYSMQALYYGRDKDTGKRHFSEFIKNKKSIFYGACEFSPELPSDFYLDQKYSSTGVCCFKVRN
jgi:hypothetical protein